MMETKSITHQHTKNEHNDYLQSQDNQTDNQTNHDMA